MANRAVQVSLGDSDFISFRCTPRCRIADHMVAQFLIDCGVVSPLPIMAVLIYIPTNGVHKFPFLNTLTSTYLLSF
jgi:hypothetical protein